MIGYGISLQIIPFFFQELTHRDATAITNIAFQIGAITAVFAFMQMISAPFWGWLSDKSGKRKNILLIGISGYALSLALTGLSSSIHWLYVTRMLNGLFSAAVIPIAIAYIIDVVPKGVRTKGLAWHGTIVGLGVVSMVCGLVMAFPQGTLVAGFIDRFSAVRGTTYRSDYHGKWSCFTHVQSNNKYNPGICWYSSIWHGGHNTKHNSDDFSTC